MAQQLLADHAKKLSLEVNREPNRTLEFFLYKNDWHKFMLMHAHAPYSLKKLVCNLAPNQNVQLRVRTGLPMVDHIRVQSHLIIFSA